MKKIVSLLLAAIMAVSLAGCASPLNPSSAEPGYPDENGNAEGYLNDTHAHLLFRLYRDKCLCMQ